MIPLDTMQCDLTNFVHKSSLHSATHKGTLQPTKALCNRVTVLLSYSFRRGTHQEQSAHPA